MTTADDDRYSRQGLIRWWSQERLRNARVLILGVGALGNEVAKNLALLGVGTLVLLDFDRIEPSNLSRTVLFGADDVGRAKVACAARALARINPEVRVQAIDGDLFYDLGLGQYRHSDLVIGCLDSIAARSTAGRACALAGVPYLDGGMWSLGGEVRWLLSGDGPCFDCTIDAASAADAEVRRSCTGFAADADAPPATVPTVATTAAIIAGLLSQECAKYLCAQAIEAGKSIVYNGQLLTMHRALLPRRADCPASHHAYRDIIELPRRAASATPADLIAAARQALGDAGSPAELAPRDIAVQLTRGFVLALSCRHCGDLQAVHRHWSRIAESERPCPRCGKPRDAEVIQSVDGDSPHARAPLAELGVPPAEVLPVHVGTRLLLFELTGDLLPPTG